MLDNNLSGLLSKETGETIICASIRPQEKNTPCATSDFICFRSFRAAALCMTEEMISKHCSMDKT